AELAQALLAEAFGGGIDGRQGLLDRRLVVLVEGAVLGVVDLEARGAGASLAIAADARATAQGILLRLAEVVEAQAEGAGAVLQTDQQAAAPAHDHVGTDHMAFDDRVLAGAQSADRHDAGAVLIAQWQVEEQVLQGLQSDPLKLFGERPALTLERGQRVRGEFAHVAGASTRGRATEQRRIESARISMALGRGKLARQAMATVRKGTGGVIGRTSSTPGA